MLCKYANFQVFLLLYMWKCNHFHVYSTVPTIMSSALGSKFRPKVVVQVWLVGPVGIDYLHIFRRLLENVLASKYFIFMTK